MSISQNADSGYGSDGLGMVGISPAIESLRSRIKIIAQSRCSVLVLGETGTGKELVAQAIHQQSDRAQGRLVSLNCAAVPEALFESELFGYEKGAFTGAYQASKGKIQESSGGTLFLDEIGEMALATQCKLLRVLENGEIFPLGACRPMRADLRIVAATNAGLEQRCENGSFRRDLYYRLKVATIRIPPLRDRPEDILPLAVHFLRRFHRERSHPLPAIERDAAQALLAHNWPGNVRELRNTVESICLFHEAGPIRAHDLPEDFVTAPVPALAERERLAGTLARTNWNVTRAAEALNWSRMTIYRKIAKYHLQRNM